MRRILYQLLPLAGLLLTLPACDAGEARAEGTEEVAKKKSAAAAMAADKQEKAPEILSAANVKVEKLIPSSLTEFIVANGTTQAIRDVTYSAEVAGKIEHLPVKLGDRIGKGRVLARIDYTTLEAQAEQAKTSFQLAESTYERLASLRDENVISRQRIDEAHSAMMSAKSSLAIAEANVKKAVVRASYPGVVGAKLVEKGEFVGPGTPMLMVVDYKTIIVEAQLAETQVAEIDRKAPVEVRIDALDRTYKGKVDTLIPTADQASKTFTLRVKIDNPNYEILIGMSAKVKIAAIEHKDVIVVPQSAVIEEQGARSVFVAKDGKAEKRSVALGPSEDDRVVLLSGVEAGEDLVVVGHRDLEEWQPLSVVQ